MEENCKIPIPIDNGENVLRAAISPYHFKKKSKELHHKVFKSRPAGTDDVSMMRHDYLGLDFCMRKGQEIVSGIAKSDVTFEGFVQLTAEQIRSCNSDVIDTREVYCGHVSMRHGFVVQEGEPMDSRANLDLDNRTKALLKICKYPL